MIGELVFRDDGKPDKSSLGDNAAISPFPSLIESALRYVFGKMWFRYRRYPTPSISIALSMAAWLCMVPVCSASDNRTALLYFDNLYTIDFSGARMENLLQCLCDSRRKLCRQDYNLQSIHYYEAEQSLASEDISEGDATGTTFLCHPGRFASADSVSCVRSSEAFSLCDGQTYCQPVYVTTSYAPCTASCVSLEWITTSLSGLNFTGYPDLVAGSCPPVTASPQTSETPSSPQTSETPPSPQTETPSPAPATAHPSASCGVNPVDVTTLIVVAAILVLMLSSIVYIIRQPRQVRPAVTN
ncbi:hypothetical protein EGW08_018909 [Elysia chlorotica]|uniref:Uncharacterized protein n=1 Tax=Elysia chlorotica TaxID=188477 RepID=A0A433SVL1_ELYCH|nr:hypothetical protein EGW08_018909 [Elysia chlorotica]